MNELLALPGWQTPPTTLQEWAKRLEESGSVVDVKRESTNVSWIECSRHRFRGYVVMAGEHIEAINFELSPIDPESARQVIEAAAQALGWEVHEDDGEDDGDEDDE
ncbi:hypothetical protein [Singulisphaera sp. PoT]|uniref:hypothetical protein n=1 Tax=Singulisphaera sp. PoT TaxID=3411797 RepID=UPI003BF5D60F